MLVVSGILLTGAGYAGEHTIYADYSRQNGWMTPVLSLVFQGWKDGIGPWELFSQTAQTAAEPETEPVEGMQGGGDGQAEDPSMPEGSGNGGTVFGGSVSEGGLSGNGVSGEDGSATEEPQVSGYSVSENKEETGNRKEGSSLEAAFTASDGKQYDQFGQLIEPDRTDADQEGSGQTDADQAEAGQSEVGQTGADQTESGQEDMGQANAVQTETVQTESGQEDMSQVNADQTEAVQTDSGLADSAGQEEVRSFVQVPESYFDDALFIGDSRTVGLSDYGGFPQSTAFFARTSLTIYDLFDEPEKFAQLADGSKATLEEALTERKFGKIYIMLGINELGRGTTESFFQVYAEAVNRIRMLQPDALIFIQGIMRVSEEKSSTDPIFNNANINARNQAISLMADNRTIFYLEINDAVCDENGNLISDYTFDQIHLKAKYYQLWKDYLLAHGILRN